MARIFYRVLLPEINNVTLIPDTVPASNLSKTACYEIPVRFFLRPQEQLARDNSLSQLLITCGWYFGWMFFTAMLLAAFLWVWPEGCPELTRKFPNLPLCVVLFVPPLFEELAFRLPLRRRPSTLGIALPVLAFLLISRSFGSIYSTDWLLLRVCVALGFAAVVWLFLRKTLLHMPYGAFFYFSALLFGAVHLFNYIPFAFPVTAAATGYLGLYVSTKTFSGVIVGYARMKHGFGFAVLLHVLHNLPLFLLS